MEMINVYEILVGKVEGKRPFRNLRCRREDSNRIHLREIEWENFNLFNVTQD